MVRIERLLSDLAQQGPELEAADPRLDDATAATVRGDYLKAAQVAEAVYEAGSLDARLLGYLLYASLLERGPAALPLLLQVALKSVTGNRQAFTPSARREVYLDGALNWFLGNMLRQLDLSERLRDGVQKAWETASAEGQLDGALALAEQLLPLVTELVPRARSPIPLRRLCDHLRLLQQQLAERRASEAQAQQAAQPAAASPAPAPAAEPPAPPAPPPPAEAVALPRPVPEKASELNAPEPEPPPDEDAPLLPGFATRSTIQASAALLQLARKLHLFTNLAERQKLQHAAVVAADIQRDLEQFDPHRYLPALVTPYLRELTRRSDELAPLLQDRDSLRFQTLEQLLHADPEAFAAEAGEEDPERKADRESPEARQSLEPRQKR